MCVEKSMMNAINNIRPKIESEGCFMEIKTGISSIKFGLNMARRNQYLDNRCILTIMIPEMMSRSIYCKKSFK